MRPLHAAADLIELGSLLKTWREARHIALSEAAQVLKLPVSSVQAIERGEYVQLGAPVYSRGFIRSFAKALGQHSEQLDEKLKLWIPDEAPALQPSHGVHVRGTPASEKYTWVISYAVGTALVLPLIWFLVDVESRSRANPTPAPPPSHVALPAPETQEERMFAEGFQGDTGDESLPTTAEPPVPQPVLTLPTTPVQASMSPFSSSPLASDLSSFEVLVDGKESWVEIIDATGKRIEFNVLKRGRHTYSGKAPFSLRAGNAEQVTLFIQGQGFPLSDYARANVARVKLSDDQIIRE
jgi:cytoskeleton protein RodZ